MNRLTAVILFVLLSVTTMATDAFGQYIDRDDSARFNEEFDKDEFSVEGRVRAVAIPGFVLDLWFDEHANHWSGQSNLSYGGAFTWRRRGSFEIGIAVDYADLKMKDAFWNSVDDPAINQDWTIFNVQFLSAVFFTNWFWNVQPWLSPYVGVGLGPGIVLGEIVEYGPSLGSACNTDAQRGTFASPSCFKDNGEPDLEGQFDDGQTKDDIPPVLPVLALNGGVRFNVAKHGMLKLELGFQDYIYAGAGAGVQW